MLGIISKSLISRFGFYPCYGGHHSAHDTCKEEKKNGFRMKNAKSLNAIASRTLNKLRETGPIRYVLSQTKSDLLKEDCWVGGLHLKQMRDMFKNVWR